jgi:hypothetical protein
MKFFSSVLLSLCLSLLCFQSYSQGCSDGGLCSVGSLGLVQFKYELLPTSENKLKQISAEDPKINIDHSDTNAKRDSSLATHKDTTATSFPSTSYNYKYPKYFFQYNTSYGLGQFSTSVITEQVDANFRLVDKKLFAQIKVPYTFVNGKLGSTKGLGDITLGLTYIAFAKEKTNLSITAGVKIPTNDANKTLNNLPLPMVYQTSLGSTDILIGAKYTIKKWDLTLGYQHSFNGNKNEYLHRSNVNDSTVYNTYFESNKLRRSDDGIIRVNRNFLSKKINVSAGLLLIYHMANDSYTDLEGIRGTIAGSRGITLNINLAGTVPLSKKLDIIFIYASPVIVRKAGPDGLMRKVVGIVGFKYNIF